MTRMVRAGPEVAGRASAPNRSRRCPLATRCPYICNRTNQKQQEEETNTKQVSVDGNKISTIVAWFCMHKEEANTECPRCVTLRARGPRRAAAIDVRHAGAAATIGSVRWRSMRTG